LARRWVYDFLCFGSQHLQAAVGGLILALCVSLPLFAFLQLMVHEFHFELH
jgi:hypothetical protein